MTAVSTTAPPRRRRSRGDLIVRSVGILGRIFVLAGVLLLFFTSYLLWGTGVYTKHEQQRLAGEIKANPTVSEANIKDGKIPPARPQRQPELGAPLFTVKIPKIGLDTVIVNGVGLEELKKGPGLFPDCDQTAGDDCVSNAMYPGEEGNVAISGHRTTYGAPFFRLNELSEGDTIDFVSGPARYRYKVRGQQVVDPVAGFPLVEQHGKSELTLTTCHPRFSAAQRLIIHADYEGASRVLSAGGPRGGPPPREVPVIPQDVIVLGAIALASALGSLAFSRKYQRTAAYLATGLVCAAGLWVIAFPRVVELLPANY